MGKVYDIAIIGGGAAGLYAAATLSSLIMEGKQLNVVLLEKMHRCGLKIGITGKGRCNLTNSKPWEEFLHNIHPKNNFFKNAFFAMSNVATMAFYEKIGLPLTEERGNRIFPKSMKANDVVTVLEKHIIKGGINIIRGAEITQISKITPDTFSVKSANGGEVIAKKVIITTGGMSYPTTGSTGDGYAFAKSLGHKIAPCFPCLTALTPKDYREEYHGISLKNVSLQLLVNGDLVQEEFGDLDFTNGGIEGPIGYKLSRRAVFNMVNGQKVDVILDLKPAVPLQELKVRVAKEFAQIKGNSIKTLLQKLMPSNLIVPFMQDNKDLTIKNLAEKLKGWKFRISGYVGYNRCVVTAGGVSLSEVSQKTMESKIVKGLYFAGEVLDLDGDTGGFNLQIAFSTGAMAANSAASTI